MKKLGFTFLGLVVMALLFLMFCFRVVSVGQVGIITRFGRVTREVQGGIVIKAPWPIEHISKMNIKTLKEQQNAAAASKDLQTVSTTVALNYHLTPKDAKTVYMDVGTNYADIVIDPIIQESVKSVTAEYNAEDLIGKRAEVEATLTNRLVSKLTDRGITIDNVSLTNFQFSSAFDQAIEQKQAAQQLAQKAQYDLQRAQQEAKAQDVQAKTLTPEYLQLQAIQKWDGKMPQAISGTNSNIFGIQLQQ